MGKSTFLRSQFPEALYIDLLSSDEFVFKVERVVILQQNCAAVSSVLFEQSLAHLRFDLKTAC